MAAKKKLRSKVSAKSKTTPKKGGIVGFNIPISASMAKSLATKADEKKPSTAKAKKFALAALKSAVG